jgi:predicted NAD-dependent protein-ADP-ribosyltransferase YbiA (DUF1768 family)/hypoxanthine phosphoribosyltransferase
MDPVLEVRQKLRILRQDFTDAIAATGNVIDSEHFLEQSAALDYAKNAVLTLFNALVQGEKIGTFKPDDAQYQGARSAMQSLCEYVTRAYYAHLVGFHGDFADAIGRSLGSRDALGRVVEHLERMYTGGEFSSRYFTRPEAGHPLVVLAATYVAARSSVLPVDTVVALPSGGTELGLAQQYACELVAGLRPSLVLVPLSMHTIKKEFDTVTKHRSGVVPLKKNAFAKYLKTVRPPLLDSKQVLVVEDNSSTGRTIDAIVGLLRRVTRHAQIHVAVAEADLVRSTIDVHSPSRSDIASASAYQHAVNVLPVSRKLLPKTDLREIVERRRLIASYRQRAKQDSGLVEAINYEVTCDLVTAPTELTLPTLNDKNAVLSFRGTFLSNFYITEICYQGVRYPSVEHAYQSQKFDPVVLSGVSKTHFGQLRDELQARGRRVDHGDLAALFLDGNMSAGNIKVCADLLRRWGYARDNWDDIKIRLMIELSLQKYGHPDLMGRLTKTGDKYLVEGNTWSDTLWGVCKGRGRNLLGRILMNIRQSPRQPMHDLEVAQLSLPHFDRRGQTDGP